MKNLKISVSLMVLTAVLLFSVSHAFADYEVTPEGERDIPAVFSYDSEVTPNGERDIPAVF